MANRLMIQMANEQQEMKELVQALAEGQIARRGNTAQTRAKILGALKVPPFNGDVTVSTYQYKQWREQIQLLMDITTADRREIAQLLFTQLSGRAKGLIRFLKPAHLQFPSALDWIWQVYDKAFMNMSI